jgi:hypothetical protein
MTEGPKHDSPGSALLEQLVPSWRDALPPSVSRAYFDGFVARNRAQLIHRLDALARRADAEPSGPPREPTTAPAKRPRGGARAVQHLDRKLVFLPLSFLLGGRRYHTPYRTLETDEIVIELQATALEGEFTPPRLVLHVAPRDTGRLAPLDLRGELHDASGDVIARFDWHLITRADFLSLSDDALARLLGVEPPEAQAGGMGRDAEDAEAKDREHIARALLPRRWAAELDLLDTMLAGGAVTDTAITARRQLEGRGVLVRRNGGAFEINDARPIEWVITPGLDLFARGHYYAAGPAEALGVLGRTLHRLGYPEPDPGIGPAFGVGRIHAKPHDELRRLLGGRDEPPNPAASRPARGSPADPGPEPGGDQPARARAPGRRAGAVGCARATPTRRAASALPGAPRAGGPRGRARGPPTSAARRPPRAGPRDFRRHDQKRSAVAPRSRRRRTRAIGVKYSTAPRHTEEPS